jgi:hypothetical protein
VYGRKWSADEAKRFYLLLRNQVIEKELKVGLLTFTFHLIEISLVD